MTEPSSYAVTVLGRDRPGIIAETTGHLAGLGLNLEDSTMTLLRGHFAMMPGGARPPARHGEGGHRDHRRIRGPAVQHEVDHCAGLLFLDRVAGAHAIHARTTYL